MKNLSPWLASSKKDYNLALDIYLSLNLDDSRAKFYKAHLNLPKNNAGKMAAFNMLKNDLLNYARIHKIKAFRVALTNKNIDPKITQSLKAAGQQMESLGKQLTKIPFKDLSVEKQTLSLELKALYKKNSSIHANLKVSSSSSKRAEYVACLLENEKEIAHKLALFDDRIPATNNLKPSGRFSKKQIENIPDENIRAESKLLRIEANKKYLARNKSATAKKQKAQVLIRKKEMKEWGQYD